MTKADTLKRLVEDDVNLMTKHMDLADNIQKTHKHYAKIKRNLQDTIKKLPDNKLVYNYAPDDLVVSRFNKHFLDNEKDRPKSTLKEMIDYELFFEKGTSSKITRTIYDLIDNASNEQLGKTIRAYAKVNHSLVEQDSRLQEMNNHCSLIDTDYQIFAKVCNAPSKERDFTEDEIAKARKQANEDLGRLVLANYKYDRATKHTTGVIPKSVQLKFKQLYPNAVKSAKHLVNNASADKTINKPSHSTDRFNHADSDTSERDTLKHLVEDNVNRFNEICDLKDCIHKHHDHIVNLSEAVASHIKALPDNELVYSYAPANLLVNSFDKHLFNNRQDGAEQ